VIRYRQIVEEYPDSPYANQAKTRFGGVGEGALDIIKDPARLAFLSKPKPDIVAHAYLIVEC